MRAWVVVVAAAAGMVAGTARAETNFFARADAICQEARAGRAFTAEEKEAIHNLRRGTWQAYTDTLGISHPKDWPLDIQVACYVADIKLTFADSRFRGEPQDPQRRAPFFEPLKEQLATAGDDPYLMTAVIVPAVMAGDARYAADVFARLEARDPELAEMAMQRLKQYRRAGASADFLAMVAGYESDAERLARSGNELEVLEVTPPPPVVVGIGERVYFRIRYAASTEPYPRVACAPGLSFKDPVSRYQVFAPAFNESGPTGEVTRWVSFSAPVTLKEICISLGGALGGESLLQLKHPVDLAWVDLHSQIPTNRVFDTVVAVEIDDGLSTAKAIRAVLERAGVKRLRRDASENPVWGLRIGNDVPVEAAQFVLRTCLDNSRESPGIVIKDGDTDRYKTVDNRIEIGLRAADAVHLLPPETLREMLKPGLAMVEFCALAQPESRSQQ